MMLQLALWLRMSRMAIHNFISLFLVLLWARTCQLQSDYEVDTLIPELTTLPTLGSEASTSATNCARWTGFDLSFVNKSHDELILNHDSVEEVCEIDNLIDRLLPSNYEVARNFDLANASRVAHINQTFATLNRLTHLAQSYRETFNPIFQKVLTRFAFLVYELQLSPTCLSSLLSLVTALNRNEMWAMKFLDSSGRVPSSILEGVLSSVGEYEECLAIQSTPTSSGATFTGQYCWAQPVIPHPLRHSYHPGDRIENSRGIPPKIMDELVDALYLLNGSFLNVALCLPSTCSPLEVQTALNTVLFPITQIPIRVGPECVTNEKRENIRFDIYQQVALLIFGGLFCITMLASIFEYFVTRPFGESEANTGPNQVTIKMNEFESNNNNGSSSNAHNGTSDEQMPKVDERVTRKQSVLSRMILAFSLVNNTRLMFRVSPNKFAAIDFIRFLMLMQIIVMHQYYVALGWSAWPLTKRFLNGLMQKAGSEYKYAFLRNIHNTDFFFALSGLLLAYSSLRNLERAKGRFNYLMFVINMYFRFYPAVLGTILLFYLLPLAGDGPFWHLVDSFHVESCRQNLAANLLTYNFYILDMETFYRHSMCNIASWWVTSCFHLILLSPLLLIPLYHSVHSLWLVVLTIVGGSLLSVGHIWLKGIPFMNQVALMNSIFEESFYSIFYSWPFIHHMAPFTLGLMVGYLIRNRPNIYLGGKFGETLLTIVFVGLSAFGFHWTQDMLKSSNNAMDLITGAKMTSMFEIYLNITVGKLMFCAGFLWIFYLCCTNRSAFLTNLCTWPGLQPLYTLSLGLYLTNFIPPLFTTFSSTDVVEFTDLLLLKNACFSFFLTVILAYIVHVLFEKPVMNILKIVESG